MRPAPVVHDRVRGAYSARMSRAEDTSRDCVNCVWVARTISYILSKFRFSRVQRESVRVRLRGAAVVVSYILSPPHHVRLSFRTRRWQRATTPRDSCTTIRSSGFSDC